MNKGSEKSDDLRPEYDFSQGQRGNSTGTALARGNKLDRNGAIQLLIEGGVDAARSAGSQQGSHAVSADFHAGLGNKPVFRSSGQRWSSGGEAFATL